MRVLVVEDEARIAADIERALAASGYLVELSDDGEDACRVGRVPGKGEQGAHSCTAHDEFAHDG